MIAVVFPGQGSQKPGMGQALHDAFPVARQVFEQVSEAVGTDVATLCFSSTEDELRATQNAQIALFTCGLAAWKALEIEASAYAGHSVGEYAAVVAAGALSVAEGAKLVWRRGELMMHAPEGTMAAVLGLEAEVLREVCKASGGVVVIANDNCPGQLVISGEIAAVADASARATEAGAKRVLPLNVSGAFHSPLMAPAAAQMGEALGAETWATQSAPVFANVSASPINDSAKWPALLEEQLVSSVRWTESVQAMIASGITTFVECGSGEVLTGLLKRIDKSVTGIAVTDSESLERAQSELKKL